MNDVSFSKCIFTADMVPYLYGEMSGRERSAFESHLVACTLCTDEFASISNARFEVYDWKRLEFDPLETPRFELPSEVVTTESSLSSVFGWVEKLRAGFATSWLVPSAALAAVAIISVFAVVLISMRDNTPEMADKNDKPNISEVGSSEVASVPTRAEILAPSENESENDGPGKLSTNLSRRSPVPAQIQEKNPVRKRKLTRLQPNDSIQAATLRSEMIPRLNEFADDEDTSLRLAELFENIEARR